MVYFKNINAVFVYVSDMEGARRFYEEQVGIGPPLLDTPQWVEYGFDGGTHFALHQATPEHMAQCSATLSTVKFSIVVDDLRAAYDELKDRGVKFDGPVEKGYGFDFAEFEDPEGNHIRILQFNAS